MVFGCKGRLGVKPSMLEWAYFETKLSSGMLPSLCIAFCYFHTQQSFSNAQTNLSSVSCHWYIKRLLWGQFWEFAIIWAMMSGCLSQPKDTSVLSLLLMWWVMGEELAAFLENILFMLLGQNILIEYMREPNKCF